MDGAQVRIEFDKKKLADLVELLGKFPKALPGVISRALNRTAQSMRSHVSADAAHALGTPAEARSSSRIHTSWAREDKLRATVYIDDKGFSLWLFRPVQNRMGVETTRGFQGAFPHAFIATPWVKSAWKHPQDKASKVMSEIRPARITRWCAPASASRRLHPQGERTVPAPHATQPRRGGDHPGRPAAGRRNTPRRSSTSRSASRPKRSVSSPAASGPAWSPG